MQIDLTSILVTSGLSMEFEVTESIENLEILSKECGVDKLVTVKGKLTNELATIKLEGMINLSYSLQCARCLKEIHKEVSKHINESFIHTKNASDSDEYIYSGKTLDIDKAVVDNILLNIPTKLICTEDCKGLCHKCGVDLNENTCQCTPESDNNTFDVLKDFFQEENK